MAKIDTPITASAETLDRVTSSELPVALVLYNSQAGGIAPEFENAMKRIAKHEAQKMLIVKVDVAESPALGLKYDLSNGSPLLVAMKNQQEVARRHRPTPGTLDNYAAYLLGRSSRIDHSAPQSPPQSSAKPVKVTDASFMKDVLQSDKPVLVDFWAAWCGPCRMIAPALEKLAGEFADGITIAKLNVDENPRTAQQYRVQGIPTLLLFKNGQVADQIVGAAPEPMLRQFIQKHV